MQNQLRGDQTMSNAISSVDDAFVAAQSLAPNQKLELISRLWEDVRVSGSFCPSDADLAEIKRRSAELDSGKVIAVPSEEVRESVRRLLESNGES
jgi:putative addiction module component (TIGR02574 family)